MRQAVRAVVVIVVLMHGVIHLLGAAEGFGWVHVSQLSKPISVGGGVLWLGAGSLVIAAAVLLGMGVRWWWVVGGAAVVASQAVIFTSWGDASAGTVVNVGFLAAVGYGYMSEGPRSYRAEYHRLMTEALARPLPDTVVTEADLAHLPRPIAAYLRQSGAVGQPRVTNFRARFHGRIRAGVAKPWMSFTGEQVNTLLPQPGRLFLMHATMFGLPVDVLHVFLARSASMRVKLCSLLPIVNATGPEMNQGETVTLFNDLCVFAPAAIVDAPVVWHEIDDRRVRGAYTYGANTVTAELSFNDDHELVDFVSDDRLRASVDGKSFLPQRWSTPVRDYQSIGTRRIPCYGEGHWHAPEPEGDFAYFEFNVDRVDYNATMVSQTHRRSVGRSRRTPAPAPIAVVP